MIKQNYYGAIDTRVLEIGDSFLLFRMTSYEKDPFLPVTVSHISEKDFVAVSENGKEHVLKKREQFCYAHDSKFVKEERVTMKVRPFFRALAKYGPDSVDKDLLDAMDSWLARQKTKETQENKGFDRD